MFLFTEKSFSELSTSPPVEQYNPRQILIEVLTIDHEIQTLMHAFTWENVKLYVMQ